MKRLRIYVDTSVIGGCFDPEFLEWSKTLIDDFRFGRYIPVISDVTAAELLPAPDFVRDLHAEILTFSAEVVGVSEETISLAGSYEARGVLGARFRNDMLHIALATVAEVDVLVSWNFRHIVRLDRIRLFNSVNIEQGYKPISIYSPREVISYGKED